MPRSSRRPAAGIALLLAIALIPLSGASVAAAGDRPHAPVPVPSDQQAAPGIEPALRKATGPQEVVVQLSEQSVAAAVAASPTDLTKAQQRAQRSRVRGEQDDFANRARSLGAKEQARVETSLNAVVVDVDASKIDQLATLPGVVSVRPVRTYEMDLSETVPYIGAPSVQASTDGGKGITVAVIDSGIDYTHAALGGEGTAAAYEAAYGANPADPRNTTTDGLFPTAKVIGGVDFVGEAWPNGPRAEDPDPIDYEGHGTHVADIIAGGLGVAPGASLLAVKVCSSVATSCDGVALLKAADYIVDPNGDGSTDDAVDVANLSLGSSYGQVQDDLSAALGNAVALGVTVVASAGNSADRPYIAGSPSTTPGIISVAQSQVPSAVTFPLVLSGALSRTVANTATVDWAPVGTGFSGDVVRAGTACPGVALPPLTGKVALIDRGFCNVSLKVDVAATAGAIGVLIANNAPGDPPSFSFGGGTTFVPTLVITQADGTAIKSALATGPVNAAVSDAVKIPMAGGVVASSSRGPSYSFSGIKPDIAAPGASVSAIAGTGTGTEAFGGTSGAAPMVSGAAALVLAARGPLPPATVAGLLVGHAETSVYTNPATQPGELAPITRVGGGEVRVDRAAAATTVASTDGPLGTRVPNLSFGFLDVAKKVKLSQRLTVENLGAARATYRLTPTFRFADDEASGAVRMKVDSSSISVPAGSSRSVKVELTIDPSKLPAWNLDGGPRGGNGPLLQGVEFDGYLTVTNSSSGEVTNVPWQVLPRKAADVAASRSSVKLRSGSGTVDLRNRGVEVGDFDAFALTGTDARDYTPAQQDAPGTNRALPDLKYVGTQFYADDDAIQFGISTWNDWAHPAYPNEFDVYVDVNRDGNDDFAIYNGELGAFASTGQTVVNVFNLVTGTNAVYYYADADLNASNMILTAPASALGIDAGTQFDFSVYALDNYFTGSTTDSITGMTMTAGTPKYAADPFGTVPGNGSSSLAVSSVPGGAAASPSQTGLLLLHRLQRADRSAEAIKVTG